jgi:hypothetical protein
VRLTLFGVFVTVLLFFVGALIEEPADASNPGNREATLRRKWRVSDPQPSKRVEIYCPKANDTLPQMFSSFGWSDELEVIGVVINGDDPNFMVFGTTVKEDPPYWQIDFDAQMDMTNAILRVEAWQDGSDVGSEVNFVIDNTSSHQCSPPTAKPTNPTKLVKGTPGQYLEITHVNGNPVTPTPMPITAGKPFTVTGRVKNINKSYNVYGASIPHSKTNNKRTPQKGARPPNQQGKKAFDITFPGPKMGSHTVRVRSWSRDAFDHVRITAK